MTILCCEICGKELGKIGESNDKKQLHSAIICGGCWSGNKREEERT